MHPSITSGSVLVSSAGRMHPRWTAMCVHQAQAQRLPRGCIHQDCGRRSKCIRDGRHVHLGYAFSPGIKRDAAVRRWFKTAVVEMKQTWTICRYCRKHGMAIRRAWRGYGSRAEWLSADVLRCCARRKYSGERTSLPCTGGRCSWWTLLGVVDANCGDGAARVPREEADATCMQSHDCRR